MTAPIRLAYETDEAGREITVSVAIDGPLGEPVFFCSSRVTGDLLIAGDSDR